MPNQFHWCQLLRIQDTSLLLLQAATSSSISSFLWTRGGKSSHILQELTRKETIFNLLQTRRNILHNTNVVQSSKQDSKPFGKFASDCSFDDSVYCIYCLGLFNKKYFASHLEQCKGKSTHSAEASCGEMLPNAGPIPPTPTLIPPLVQKRLMPL